MEIILSLGLVVLAAGGNIEVAKYMTSDCTGDQVPSFPSTFDAAATCIEVKNKATSLPWMHVKPTCAGAKTTWQWHTVADTTCATAATIEEFSADAYQHVYLNGHCFGAKLPGWPTGLSYKLTRKVTADEAQAHSCTVKEPTCSGSGSGAIDLATYATSDCTGTKVDLSVDMSKDCHPLTPKVGGIAGVAVTSNKVTCNGEKVSITTHVGQACGGTATATYEFSRNNYATFLRGGCIGMGLNGVAVSWKLARALSADEAKSLGCSQCCGSDCGSPGDSLVAVAGAYRQATTATAAALAMVSIMQ